MTRGSGRVELKYAVPEDVAAHVLSLGLAFLDREVHAAEQRQRITSLYLDTPHRTFLRWHRARAADRFSFDRDGTARPSTRGSSPRSNGNTLRCHETTRACPRRVHSLSLVRVKGSMCTSHGLGIRTSCRICPSATAIRRETGILVTCVRESLRGSFPEEKSLSPSTARSAFSG